MQYLPITVLNIFIVIISLKSTILVVYKEEILCTKKSALKGLVKANIDMLIFRIFL